MALLLSRNFALDLVRATEAAALGAGRWMGMNQPAAADQAANAAMLGLLSHIEMDGRIVVGERSPAGPENCFRPGQAIGTGNGPAVDLVVDAIDGCRLLAQGYGAAISVAAIAPRGTMWAPTPAVYMDKIVVGADLALALAPECLDAPAAWTLALAARVKKKPVRDLVVYVLNRPRHDDLVAEIRAAGAHVLLSPEGDILGALLAITPGSGVDLLMGTGGVPEGLMAACAIRAAGGAMLGRLDPQSQVEKEAIAAAGFDAKRILTADQLVASSEVFFAATGISDGPLLQGVRYAGNHAASNSMTLRGETRTRRKIISEHLLED